MIVSMWMQRSVITVSPDVRIDAAAHLMVKNRIRRLPVVRDSEGGKRVVGILVNTDLYHAYPADVNPFRVDSTTNPEDLPEVKKVMSSPVIHIKPDEPIENASAMMRTHRISALPVIAEDELVGIITESDIFKVFSRILSGGPNPVRVTFDGMDKGLEGLADQLTQAATRSNTTLASLITFEWKGQQRAIARAVGSNPEGFIEKIRMLDYRVLNIQRGR